MARSRTFVFMFVACFCISNALASEESLEIVSSRGGDQRFLLIKPNGNPSASIILFAGGNGQLSLSSFLGSPTVGEKKKNFLVRTRELFAEHGFLVATIDAPENPGKMTPFWRMDAEHAEDVSAVIAFLKQQADVPVWAVGTSLGSFSAANIAIRLNTTIHGVVLTSTPTEMQPDWKLYEKHPRGVISMELDKVTGPALVIAHEKDACVGPNPKYIPDLAKAFTSSPNVEQILYSGPDVRVSSDPCSGMGPHGFLNMESEVVDAIAKFIKSN